jgi:hypothetical protein
MNYLDCHEEKKSRDSSEMHTCQTISEIIKQHYDITSDSVIYKLTGPPSWLNQMINDKVFRKMLIEMYDQHKSSALLGLCLKEISSRGFHRFILSSILVWTLLLLTFLEKFQNL